MPEDQKSGFSEAVETGASAAHTIRGAIKTGKAISSAAKGAAAGGPYGAVAGAVWAGRKHIGKIIVAVIALLMLPVLFVLMLPGLIFGGLTNAFSPSDPEIPILNSETAIIENANEITFTLNGILGEALDDVLARIEADFAASGADHMEVKNAYSGGPIYNANLFISQYCAAKDKDFESISLNDLAATLRENKQHLYSYTSKQEIRESTVTDPETGEETTEPETWMVYTVRYNGESYFSDVVFQLTDDQKELAADYASNLSLFLGDGLLQNLEAWTGNSITSLGDVTFTDGITPVVYYNQLDERYAGKAYGTDNIGGYGCGPTAMAIVVSSLTDDMVDPVEMAEWSYNNGYAEENRNIGEVYRLLTLNGESQLDTLFEALPSTHPAKAPYSLFKQASDTVRSGVIIGLGSRLQVFQSELIKKITAKNEIDLELPGQQPCAYFLVTSDQDSTFDFLASLFLSFCFIKLVRYADHNCEGGKLPVPVHILGEELTACGTIPDLSRRLSVIRSRNISMSCVFQNLAGLQNRYPQNLWQEIIGNCDAQLFLGCTDQLTAEFISARTGLASVAVSSKSKQLGTWRISNYTPEFRETSGVGKRPVLTPDEVLRLPLDQALIIIRGKKVLQVDKMDYSKHPEAKYLRSCKASAHVPEWRRLEEEAAKTPQPAPKPAPAAKKPAKRKATKPASPTDKSPKEAPAPKSAGTPEGIITTDKDSILS